MNEQQRTSLRSLADSMRPTPQDFAAWGQSRFETDIVIMLCSHHRVPKDVRESLRVSAPGEAAGLKSLQLHDFCYNLDYPVRLGTDRIPAVAKDAPLSKLFTDFTRRAFIKAYEALEDRESAYADGRPLGLVFHWPYLGGAKALVLSNREPTWDVPGVRMVWVGKDPTIKLTLELLPVFMASVDRMAGPRGWRPHVPE